jgi:predicted metal-dependent peptidase
MVGPSLTVAFVVDTSASVTESGLSAALSEIRAVMRSAGVARDRVKVLCVDAASANPQRVNRVQDITLVGGGGTDMRVGIAAAEKLVPAPDIVITLTDGDTPWPAQRGRAQLVCVIIDNPSAVARTPDFAITVEVPPERG